MTHLFLNDHLQKIRIFFVNIIFLQYERKLILLPIDLFYLFFMEQVTDIFEPLKISR